jgi:hypothetical protein
MNVAGFVILVVGATALLLSGLQTTRYVRAYRWGGVILIVAGLALTLGG